MSGDTRRVPDPKITSSQKVIISCICFCFLPHTYWWK